MASSYPLKEINFEEFFPHHFWSLEERKQVEEEHPSPTKKKQQHTHIYIYKSHIYIYVYYIFITNIFHRFLFYSGLLPPTLLHLPKASAWHESRGHEQFGSKVGKRHGWSTPERKHVWICWWIFLIERSFLKPSIYLLMRVVIINSWLICNCIYKNIIHIMRK